MKTITYKIKISNKVFSFNSHTIKRVIIGALILTSNYLPVSAQKAPDANHSWWFGIAAGTNINFYQSSIQDLNSDLISPVVFNKGSGIGLYFASLAEYHPLNSAWGIMLQAGYDSRKGKFDEKTAPCGCTEDLSTDLSYINIEPSLIFAPFKSNFFLFAGPRLAINLNKSFIYTQDIHSGFLDQEAHFDKKMNFGNMNKTTFSTQIGAGYDVPISSLRKQTKFVLSPFVSFQPYFGQSPRSIENWDITTLRIGIILKFSVENKIFAPVNSLQSDAPLF